MKTVRNPFKTLAKAAGVAAAFAMAAQLAMAVGPPTTYTADTSTTIHNNPYPTLLNWGGINGAINQVQNDPAFGTPIIRITNAATSINNRGLTTPDSAEARAWNTNSTLFRISDVGGGKNIAFSFNPTTLVATKFTFTGTPPDLHDFSATNANICYTLSGTNVQTFDFSHPTNPQALVVNIQALTSVPLNGRLAGDYHASRNDVVSVLGGGTVQNTDFLCIAYDTVAHTYFALNTTEPNGNGTDKGTIRNSSGTITGTFKAGTACATKFHNATIAPGGRYVCLDAGDGSGIVAIWDTQTSTVYPVGASNGGHKCMGYGPGGNGAWCNNSTNLAHNNSTWLIRGMTSTGVTTYNDLCEHPAADPQRFDSNHLSYDSHLSWANSRSNASQPMFVDTYHNGNDTADPHCCWGDEIIAIGTALTANNPVYRFAQHRSTQNVYSDGTEFYDTPRGNISQDGLFFMFTSNQGNTLGTVSLNGLTKNRMDVFVLKLTPGP